MRDATIRIRGLCLKHIKNTAYGSFKMPQGRKAGCQAGILGIYGQNGSGKTAVIDALFLVQQLLSGNCLSDEMSHYIEIQDQGEGEGEILLELTVENSFGIFDVEYCVRLQRIYRDGIWGLVIQKEIFASSRRSTGACRKPRPCLIYTRGQTDLVFTPKVRLKEVLEGSREKKGALAAAKKTAELTGCSYIFGRAGRELLCQESGPAFAQNAALIKALYLYGKLDLFVIQNRNLGLINANLFLPIEFQGREEMLRRRGEFLIPLREPAIVLEERYGLLARMVGEISRALEAIVPGCLLEICDYGPIVTKEGEKARRIELVSRRGGLAVPVRYESEGIIRLISILNVFMRAYNDSGICLAVDELDSGMYEYLLGELLDLFAKGGRGQLLFTAHNLRPLEMLPSDSILFSTDNPENRYIQIKKFRRMKNQRDQYLRSITLGGHSEKLYTETDSLKIARIFRKAERQQ